MGEGTENGQARDESVGLMAGIGGDNGNCCFLSAS